MSYPSKAYTEQGGDNLVIASGGEIDIESGGAIKIAGTAVTSTAAELNILDGVTATAAELNKNDASTMLETKVADYVVTAADSGKTFLSGAVDLKFTLPSTAAGLTYTFVCHTVSATTGLQVDPAAADAIHYVTSVDDKDLINTPATDVEGDSVTVVGDGVDGWWIKAIDGIWAKE